MEQRVRLCAIESKLLWKNSVRRVQVHTVFDSIYLQLLYRHHEREEHERKLPKTQIKIQFQPNCLFRLIIT